MFEAVGGAGGTLLRAQPRGAASARRTPPAGAAAGFTDEDGRLLPADDATQAVAPEVRARARAIAARLSLPRPQRASTARRPGGRPVTLPYRGGSDDIDLDRTLESLAEHPVPEDEDIFVREPARTPRSVVLAVDLSGSMKGERVRTAAATVGALAAELERDALAVVAFWSDAALLLKLGDPIRPMELLDAMLRIPARGLTNVAFPLRLAAQQLASAPPRGARVLLLSDCVHNAGPDPRPFAARLPRLDVLLDASGEKDEELGAELARAGRGTYHAVRTHHGIAPALGDIFRT
ncbi:vWA domain-containing protein [Streptomyces avicenniae]|uniref:vWA domain-containing protein n=1 Tax=Streptomyces avicenniae TaxID=500153 RepID=UPI000AA238D8|nr:VWA domain-containing protein [Streptomyces avicenniae]